MPQILLKGLYLRPGSLREVMAIGGTSNLFTGACIVIYGL